MPPFPQELLGPLGLLVGTLIVIYAGFKEWWVPGSRLRRSDEALQRALELLRTSSEANKTMADAMEDRNQLDIERLRLAQAGLLDELGEPTRRRTRRPTSS